MFAARLDSDERIVRKVLGGHRESFGLLVERYLRAVHAVAYSRTGNVADAEDVAQEAFVRAFRCLHTLQDPKKFAAWLINITRNTASTFVSKRRRQREIQSGLEPCDRVDLDMERRELCAIVRKQVMQLDEANRELLLLRYFSGKSLREIAGILGISLNAAKKRVARARETLGNRLFHELEKELPRQVRREEETKRIMGVIVATPVSWKVGAPNAGLPVPTGVFGRLMLMKKAGVGVAVVACVAVSGITLLPAPPAPVGSAGPPATPVVLAGAREHPPQGSRRTTSPHGRKTDTTIRESGNAASNDANTDQETGPEVLGRISGIVVDAGRVPVPFAEIKATPVDGAMVIAERESRSRAQARNYYLVIKEDERLAGFSVKASASPPDFPAAPEEYSATADASGNFSFRGIGSGGYRLMAVPANAWGEVDDSQTQVVWVSPDSHNVAGLELVVSVRQAVWGRVSDREGRPIPNVRMSLDTSDADTAQIRLTEYTDQDGSYWLGLPDGDRRLHVQASARGFLTCSRDGVSPGSEQNLTLERCPRIEGHVLDAATGTPITNFSLGHRPASEDQSGEPQYARFAIFETEVNDAEGRFSTELECAGDVTFLLKASHYALHAEHLSGIRPGETIQDVVIRIKKGFPILGTVVDTNGNPVRAADIFLDYPLPSASPVAQSKADGTFEIWEAPLELELISAVHPSFATAWATIRCDSSCATSVRFVFEPGGSLEGVVTLDGQALGEEEGSISVRFPNGMTNFLTCTDSGGRYRIDGVTPGLTRVHGTPRLDPATELGPRHWLEAGVEVKSGHCTTLDFDFRSEYDAVLEGMVILEDRPLPGANVRVSFERDDGMRAFFGTHSDADGLYRLEDIPAGVLNGEIHARIPAGPFMERIFTAQIQSGDSTTLDLEMTP